MRDEPRGCACGLMCQHGGCQLATGESARWPQQPSQPARPPARQRTWLAMMSVRRPAARAWTMASTGRMMRARGGAPPAAASAATSATSAANWVASLQQGGKWGGGLV